MPWEEEKERGTNSPSECLPEESPTSYNDPRSGKPVWRKFIRRQPISISSLPLPSFSPNTKRYIKSLTSDDGNNLGEVGSASQKRIGNHEDLPVARRRKLMDVFGDSGIENSVNATPTKDKSQTNLQNNTAPRTPLGELGELDDTSPHESTTSTKLDFDEEYNEDNELNEKVAAEKELVGNDIVGGVGVGAVGGAVADEDLFGLDSSLSSLQDELSGDEERQDGAATASIATVGGAAGIVPADNRDGDGKGLKSDEVRDELTGGKESGSAAASAAVNPPSEAVCDVGTSTNLSEEVGRDADTTSRAAANGEDSLSEESCHEVQETCLPSVRGEALGASADAKKDASPSSALAFYQHRKSSLEEVNTAVGYNSSQWRNNNNKVVPNELLRRIPQLQTNKATLGQNNCHPDCHAICTSNVVQVDVAHFASLSAVGKRLLEFEGGKYFQTCWDSKKKVDASILVEAFSFTPENAENFIANHVMTINVIPELMKFDAHSRGDRSTYNAIKERHSETQKTVFESLTDVCHNTQTMSVFGKPAHNTMREWGFFKDAHALSTLLGGSSEGPIGHMTLLACGIMSAQQRDRLIKHTIEQYCRVFNLDPADHQLSEEQMDRIIKCTYNQALISKHVEPHIIELSEQIVSSMLDKSNDQIEAVKAEIASWLAILSTKDTNAIVASIKSIKTFIKHRPEGCTDLNISYYKCDKCDNQNLTQYNAQCGCSGNLRLRRVMNDDGTMSEDYIDPLIPASCTNCGHCGIFNNHCTVCLTYNQSLELDEAHLRRSTRTMHCTHPTFGEGSSWTTPLFYEIKTTDTRSFLVQTYASSSKAAAAMVKRLEKTEDFPVDARGVHTTDFESSVRSAFFNRGNPQKGVSSGDNRKLRDLLSDVIPGEGGTRDSSKNKTRYRNCPWNGIVQYGPYHIQGVGTPLPCLGNRVV